jgi:hypothetical protein
MLTNKQMVIIGVFALAITAMLLGCSFEDVARLLPILLGLG